MSSNKSVISRHDQQGDVESDNKLSIPLSSGDLVLFSRNCTAMDPFSMVICLGAKTTGMSPYDHVGMIVEDPTKDDGELLLLEANAKGITMYPLTDRLQRSKAKHIAIRKLVHPTGTTDSPLGTHFKLQLFNYVQQFLTKGYNQNMFQMTSATAMSYYYAFVDDLFSQQIQSLHYLIDEYELIQQVIGNKHPLPATKHRKYLSLDHSLHALLTSQSSSLPVNVLFLGLITRKQQLHTKIKQAQEKLDLSTVVAVKNDSKKVSEAKADSYFCSQLVAEIYQHFHILHPLLPQSQGKDAYHYLPADFSSSTWKKGLFTHRVLDEDTNHFVTFSPDFTTHPKACRLVRNNNECLGMCLEIPLTLLKHQQDGKSVEGKGKIVKEVMRLPMHLNDIVPPAILRNMLSLARKHDLQFKLKGKLRILHQPSGAVVGMIDADDLQHKEEDLVLDYLADRMKLYGEDNICVQAYCNDASLTLVTNSNRITRGTQPLGHKVEIDRSQLLEGKQDVCPNDQKLDMMLIEEVLHQAWLGLYQTAASSMEKDILHMNTNSIGVEDVGNIMEKLLRQLYASKTNFSVQILSKDVQEALLLKSVQNFREVVSLLGKEVLDVFLHHHKQQQDYNYWQKHFIKTKAYQLEESIANEENKLFYTLKHLFYLCSSYEILQQRHEDGSDLTEALTLFHYLLKHYVLDDHHQHHQLKAGVWKGSKEYQRRQALVESIMNQVEDKFQVIPTTNNKSKDNDKDKKTRMVLAIVLLPTSIGAFWQQWTKNTTPPSSPASSSTANQNYHNAHYQKLLTSALMSQSRKFQVKTSFTNFRTLRFSGSTLPTTMINILKKIIR